VTIVREAERERPYRASEADPALAQELLAESRCALEGMWTAACRLGETENYLVTLGNKEDAQRLAGMGASLLWLADCLCRRLGIGLPKWGAVRAHLGVPDHSTGEAALGLAARRLPCWRIVHTRARRPSRPAARPRRCKPRCPDLSTARALTRLMDR
jgi:hypothetical protein